MKRIFRWMKSFLDWLNRPAKEEPEESYEEWLDRQW